MQAGTAFDRKGENSIMKALDRFLRYVAFDTQSAEDTGTTPSTFRKKLRG